MVFLKDIQQDATSHLSEWLKSKTPNALLPQTRSNQDMLQ